MPGPNVFQRLSEGCVIPAHPLALTPRNKLDERCQRALTRYFPVNRNWKRPPGSQVGPVRMLGAPLPFTVSLNVQLTLFLLASINLQVTVVVPIGNVLPEAGTHATAGLGSHSSVTVGAG